MVHQGRDSKQWIQDVKFNADGTTFAVGSHDNIVYLYDARGGRFTLRGRCTAHQSYITHFDFARDGTYLQSNCGAYELLFFNAGTGEQVPAASSLRDVDWATWTCVLGWPVQGIWPKEADGTDINSVDRSHSQKYLATSDDFGRVNIFNYPCLEKVRV
jgi:WD40 repeat protein